MTDLESGTRQAISHPRTTEQFCHILERRGIPAQNLNDFRSNFIVQSDGERVVISPTKRPDSTYEVLRVERGIISLAPIVVFGGVEVVVIRNSGELDLIKSTYTRAERPPSPHQGSLSVPKVRPQSISLDRNVDRITTEVCKGVIVEWCKANRIYISSQFVEPLSEEMLSKAEDPRNWKRISKATAYGGEGIEREFDCRPFDDQLRAIVLSDIEDKKLLSVIVQGE